MNQMDKAKLCLLVLRDHERISYEDEINEIFDCILEDKSWDFYPGISRIDLINLLENLGHQLIVEDVDSDYKKVFRDWKNGFNQKTTSEALLRKKIKSILMET